MPERMRHGTLGQPDVIKNGEGRYKHYTMLQLKSRG
jgi:hypothetical protein